MRPKNSFSKGMALLLLAQAMVGMNIVISKLLLASFPILTLLVFRFAIATVILLPLHWTTAARKHSLKAYFARLGPKDWGFIIAQGLCAGVLFNWLMVLGLNQTDANVAGIITSALPAIIAIMSWLILGEKISLQKGFCVAFATVGLIVIAYDKLQGLGDSHSFLGDFIVLIALIPEATYYILCKLYSNRLPLFLTSSLLNGFNALILILVLLLSPWEPTTISGLNWFLLGVTGLSSGLFYVCWFLGSQWVDSIMASLSTAIMPVSAVLFAWMILGEQFSLLAFAGMSLVIFSIILYARR